MKIYHLKTYEDSLLVEKPPFMLVADFPFRIFANQLYLNGKHYKYIDDGPTTNITIILSDKPNAIKIKTIRPPEQGIEYSLLSYC